MELESKAERIFGIACLGKKLVFHTEICYYFKYIILKIALFRRVKELSKMNQTGNRINHGCLECKTKKIVIACLGKMLAFHTEICDYFQYLVFKYSIFYRVKELFKSNHTWYGVSPVELESKAERIFGIACLGKKLVFHTEICYYFKYIILKIALFRRVKELSKMNQTGNRINHGCLECKTKKIVIACLGKMLAFHTEICDYFQYLVFKYSIFYRVKELFKSNHTWYGVSPVELESKAERFFGIACLGKKLVFHTEICYYFKYIILKIALFRRVKELSKMNQTGNRINHGCLECKTKKIVIACLGKMLAFHTEICYYFI